MANWIVTGNLIEDRSGNGTRPLDNSTLNRNETQIEVPITNTGDEKQKDDTFWTIIYVMSGVLCFILLGICVTIGYKCAKKAKKPQENFSVSWRQDMDLDFD